MAKTKKSANNSSININISNADVEKTKNFLSNEFHHPIPQDKAYTFYILLVWLLGGFGAHRFYAGKTKSGLIMLGCLFVGAVFPPVLLFWLAWCIFDFVGAYVSLYEFEKATRIKK